MKKKMTIIFTMTILLIVCFFAGLYVIGSNNEAYKFAIRFIDRNSIVIANMGPLKNHRLSLFGYSVKHEGPREYAEYKIIVTGEKSKGEIYLNLEKSAGEWKVLKGNLILPNKMSISLIGK